MTTETTPSLSAGQKFLRGLGWLAKFILRLLFVLVVGTLLGFGIYWGAAYGIAAINQQVFQPIRDHTQRLNDLESRYTQDYEQLNEHTQALQERIDTLETQADTTRETLDALQSRLTASEALLAEMQTTLETAQ